MSYMCDLCRACNNEFVRLMFGGMGAKEIEPWADVMRLTNPEHRERLARVEQAMSGRIAGARVPRSSVLAAVIEAGLEAVERELQIGKRGK
jgi:hypothetical protein